jgi:hypothetical protein
VKRAADIVEALDQALGNFDMEKIDAAMIGGALAMLPPGATVEERDRVVVA